jgi:hypothetical protein
MTSHAATFRTPRLRLNPGGFGGLLVGTFDLLFACTWWKVAHDVPPIRIFQSIGSGLLGEASYEGGMRSAASAAWRISSSPRAWCWRIRWSPRGCRACCGGRSPWACRTGFPVRADDLRDRAAFRGGAVEDRECPWVIASIVVHVLIGIGCAYIARRAVR